MSQNLNPNPTYDVIILGASAIAGRNASKLFQALQWASGPNPPPEIPILTADISDPSSLRHLASQTKIILNCVGPFRLYACGFDSVPAELGLMFNSRQWMSPSVPNSVEAYLSLESDKRIVTNFTSYESAVLGEASVDKLQELRQNRPKRPRPVIPGPRHPNGPLMDHQKEIGVWAVKLPSADAIVVQRTLSCLAENPNGLPGVNESTEHVERREAFWSSIKPAHFGVKIASKSVLRVVCFITVVSDDLGKQVQLKMKWQVLPLRCGLSDTGLAMAVLHHQETGRPDTEIITRVIGPETPIILVQCALILLKERHNLPKGRVLPPGIDCVWPNKPPRQDSTEWNVF
ncbi:putative anthocyanidin 3-O-glucosyltransferase 5-like [Capsicum annuum]|nr:putative anthocyanidin 3-O-glucosyltransferase 5-like [Capsicum annuum]